MSNTEQQSVHWACYQAGYQAAIHDARIEGSTAHDALFSEQAERTRLIAACLETARAEVKAALDLLEELRS